MQYDSPVSATNFQAFLNAPAFSDVTAAAISSLLSLDTAQTLNVGTWDGVNAPQVQAGQTADVFVANIAGLKGDLVVLDVPASLEAAKALVFQSDANLSLTIDAPAAAVSASQASVAAADPSTTIALAVTTGNGDDIINVKGDQNTFIDGGDGNDTITTGNGNNTVVAGIGNNVVTTGTGNDTIILSGIQHTDIVNAGGGYDVVQLDGSSADFTLTIGNSNNVTLASAANGVGQTAAITDAEFLSFTNGSTIALAHSDAEASALRLYEGLLGRDADVVGAQHFTDQVDAGTSLTDIANQFLNSQEFGGAVTEGQINTLYTSILGRAADAGGSDTWEALIANGGSLADVAAGIAGSVEAQQLDQSNGAFVRDLYTNVLGRPADDAGLDSWVSQLFNGTSRGEVAAGIVGSAEASNKADSTFIDNLYLSATGRASDEGGKATWTELLANGGTHADVAIGIVGSPEAVAHNDNVVVLHGAV
jgi:hypothetical protein